MTDPLAALLAHALRAPDVRAALAEAISEALPSFEAPRLLDRRGIARALGVSLGTIDRLRRDGLPTVVVGDAPRFVLSDCVEWLRRRQGEAPGLRLVRPDGAQ